jgi:hypothetical protein
MTIRYNGTLQGSVSKIHGLQTTGGSQKNFKWSASLFKIMVFYLCTKKHVTALYYFNFISHRGVTTDKISLSFQQKFLIFKLILGVCQRKSMQ